MMHRFGGVISIAIGTFLATPAWAELPSPWQMGMVRAASPSITEISALHDLLLVIMTVITIFVLGLLIIVMIKFNEKANPAPSKTTHHAGLEIAWTVIPIVLLIAIGLPSFKLLYFTDRTENPELTLKAIGNQWYWSYEYPDQGIEFDSNLVAEEDLKEGQIRLLAVDNAVVLPVETDIRILITANDVNHAWAVPQLVYKVDAVPGRISETWMRINEEGTFYGQCSELCGVMHSRMPIVVHAVSKDAFAVWVAKTKAQATLPDGVTKSRYRVAQARATAVAITAPRN